MKIRPAKKSDLNSLWGVRLDLCRARRLSIEAGCPKLTKKIRSAIASLGGAERHLRHRLARMT